VSGIDAIWIEYRAKLQGRRLTNRQVILVHDGDGIVITFSATKSSFSEQLEAELLVEESLQFDD
jgi:hypothetical protein